MRLGNTTVQAIRMRCPKCGSVLLSDGDKVWCSFVGGGSEKACDFGLDYDVLISGLQAAITYEQAKRAAQVQVINDETIEKLAAYAHTAWSNWMIWMFDRAIPDADGDRLNDDGSWTMPAYFVERWHRQMLTPYADLPESEKESDRKEARAILAIIAAEASHAE